MYALDRSPVSEPQILLPQTQGQEIEKLARPDNVDIYSVGESGSREFNTSDWTVYQDEEYGVEFSYPKGSLIMELPTGLNLKERLSNPPYSFTCPIHENGYFERLEVIGDVQVQIIEEWGFGQYCRRQRIAKRTTIGFQATSKPVLMLVFVDEGSLDSVYKNILGSFREI